MIVIDGTTMPPRCAAIRYYFRRCARGIWHLIIYTLAADTPPHVRSRRRRSMPPAGDMIISARRAALPLSTTFLPLPAHAVARRLRDFDACFPWHHLLPSSSSMQDRRAEAARKTDICSFALMLRRLIFIQAANTVTTFCLKEI